MLTAATSYLWTGKREYDKVEENAALVAGQLDSFAAQRAIIMNQMDSFSVQRRVNDYYNVGGKSRHSATRLPSKS